MYMMQALEAENMELRDELHAVSDDLEALVHENQAIGGQAIAAATERDAWREDAAAANTRAAAAEAAARAADADTERLRKSYEVPQMFPPSRLALHWAVRPRGMSCKLSKWRIILSGITTAAAAEAAARAADAETERLRKSYEVPQLFPPSRSAPQWALEPQGMSYKVSKWRTILCFAAAAQAVARAADAETQRMRKSIEGSHLQGARRKGLDP